MAACLTPTAAQTIPHKLSLSPDGVYLAVAHRNHIVEVFRFVEGTWRSFAVYEERLLFPQDLEYDSICALSWHPSEPCRFVVAFTRGKVFSVTFIENGDIWTESTIDLSRAINKWTPLVLREPCFNDQVTEMSAAFGDQFLAYSDPWGVNGIERISVYGADSLRSHVAKRNAELVFTGYIGERQLLLVYSLGFLAVSTLSSPPNVLWDIKLSKSRQLIPGGSLSPDKSKFLGITVYNEVEVYDLHARQFLAKVTHSGGPFRSIIMAVYIDRDSLALVHKLPQGDEHHVDIILRLQVGSANMSFGLRIGHTQPGTPMALMTLYPVFHGGLINGRGHLVFVKDLIGRVAVICPEDFGVTSGIVHMMDPVNRPEAATNGSLPGIPLDVVEPDPNPLVDDSQTSEVQNLEDTREPRDITIEQNIALDPGHGGAADFATDANHLGARQQAESFIAHAQDDGIHFPEESAPAQNDEHHFTLLVPPPEFQQLPAAHLGSSTIMTAPDDPEPFVAALGLILYFLITIMTLVCYVAVAIAISEYLVN